MSIPSIPQADINNLTRSQLDDMTSKGIEKQSWGPVTDVAHGVKEGVSVALQIRDTTIVRPQIEEKTDDK